LNLHYLLCVSFLVYSICFVRVESGESLDKTREDKGRGNKQTEEREG